MTLSFGEIEQAWTNAGGPAGLAPLMAAIAEAESSGENVIQQGQPYATTGWGLWQITPGNSEPQVGTDNQLLDPNVNAAAALAKYNSQGLGAWQGDRAYNIWQQHGSPTNPTVADLSAWGIDTSGASQSAYSSPVGAGLVQGRTDQGVDFSGSGPLYAVGPGTIVAEQASGWGSQGNAGIGALITEKLNNPPDAQHTDIYYAENIDPSVSLNQQVTGGQQIGTATGTGSGIEIGWADPNNPVNPLAPLDQNNPGAATTEGTNFANFLSSGLSSGGGIDVPSAADNAQTFTGFAGFLQKINDLLNPTNTNSTFLFGGTISATENLVELVVFRGMFTILFGVVTYVGIKMLTGKSSGPQVISQIIPAIQSQQRTTTQRSRISSQNQAEAGRAERARLSNEQADKERANPTVRRSEYNSNRNVTRTSTITHVTTPKEKIRTTVPQSKSGPSGPGPGQLAKEVLEAAAVPK